MNLFISTTEKERKKVEWGFEFKASKLYLNEGTGNDWPRHRTDNEWFIRTSTSWRRPPDIFGATLPTGSLSVKKKDWKYFRIKLWRMKLFGKLPNYKIFIDVKKILKKVWAHRNIETEKKKVSLPKVWSRKALSSARQLKWTVFISCDWNAFHIVCECRSFWPNGFCNDDWNLFSSSLRPKEERKGNRRQFLSFL